MQFRLRCPGFSLLELMVVIAIIGILATLAIPSYHSHINRAKFLEVIQATAPYKLAVSVCVHEHGSLDNCGVAGKNGIPQTYTASDAKTGYTAKVEVTDKGKIVATSQQIIATGTPPYTYILTPALQANGQLVWQTDLASSCLVAGLCR